MFQALSTGSAKRLIISRFKTPKVKAVRRSKNKDKDEKNELSFEVLFAQNRSILSYIHSLEDGESVAEEEGKTLLDIILENTQRGVLGVIPESFWRLSDEELKVGKRLVREYLAKIRFIEQEGQITGAEWRIMQNPDVRAAIMNNPNAQILADVLQDIKLNMKPIDDINNYNSQNVENKVAITIPILCQRPSVFKSEILCHDCFHKSIQHSEKVEGVAGQIPFPYTAALFTVAYGVIIMSIFQITSTRIFQNISSQLVTRIGSLIPVTLPIQSMVLTPNPI